MLVLERTLDVLFYIIHCPYSFCCISDVYVPVDLYNSCKAVRQPISLVKQSLNGSCDATRNALKPQLLESRTTIVYLDASDLCPFCLYPGPLLPASRPSSQQASQRYLLQLQVAAVDSPIA